jgi:hypothetical protein
MINYQNINDFFSEVLKDLKCQEDTRAYIVSIYGKYRHTNFDLSKDSITLLFSQARLKQNFSIYQNIGDWLLVELADDFINLESQVKKKFSLINT